MNRFNHNTTPSPSQYDTAHTSLVGDGFEAIANSDDAALDEIYKSLLSDIDSYSIDSDFETIGY